MSISIYDPTWWSNIPGAAQRGGQSRAKTAKRLQGKFLPNDEFLASLVKADSDHGRVGGKRNAETCKRIKGKFARKS